MVKAGFVVVIASRMRPVLWNLRLVVTRASWSYRGHGEGLEVKEGSLRYWGCPCIVEAQIAKNEEHLKKIKV